MTGKEYSMAWVKQTLFRAIVTEVGSTAVGFSVGERLGSTLNTAQTAGISSQGGRVETYDRETSGVSQALAEPA